MQKSLNELTESEWNQVKELAALFFTPREICIMVELKIEEVTSALENETSDFYLKFNGGRMQAEVDLRTAVMQLAKSGSSPAQTMALDFVKSSKLKMLDK